MLTGTLVAGLCVRAQRRQDGAAPLRVPCHVLCRTDTRCKGAQADWLVAGRVSKRRYGGLPFLAGRPGGAGQRW